MFKVEQFLPDSQTIATINIAGASHRITRKSLSRYGRMGNIEGGYCQKYRNYLLVFLGWASNQAGIIAIWDCKTKRWVHVSSGEYGLIFMPLPEIGAVLTACYVSNYLTTGHLRFYVSPFKIKDRMPEGTNIIIDLAKLEPDRLPFNPIAEGVTEGVVLPKGWLDAEYDNKFGSSGFWHFPSEKLMFHFEGESAVSSFEEISKALHC